MKHYILIYKEQAKNVKAALNESLKNNNLEQHRAQTPGGPLNSGGLMGVKGLHSSGILTPQGTKPFIKAFCPSTPLKDNYPSKHLSMRTIM